MAYMTGAKRVWRKDSEFASKADAELVQKEIDALAAADANGKCTNQALVDFARTHPKSESYKCFEWDDKKAAERHRLSQAGRIKCEIMIVGTPTPTNAAPQPIKIETCYNHSLPTPGQGHKNLDIIIQDANDMKALDEAMRRAIETFVLSFEKRYRPAPSFDKYYAEVQKLLHI